MKKIFLFSTIAILSATVIIVSSCGGGQSKEGEAKSDTAGPTMSGPFQDHRDSVPTKAQYDGPLFVLSHNYPTTAQALVNPPWQQALNGQPIDSANTIAYMNALKNYIAANLLPFFTNNKEWTAAKYGWFQEPWMGADREAILGAYLGNGNDSGMFTTLNEPEAGYAVVLYDSLAGYTVGQIWGTTGQKVNLVNDAAQFKEGSVIVKLAFSNINAPQWPVMQGAQTFSIYDTGATTGNPKTGYQVRTVSFFQMDVIVKDSKTAPKTGWVYSTFVYDMNATGTSYWDKMVPLGAMWGNDPDVKSPQQPPYPKLYETVINPAAPKYSTETLGWGGRLSGPNDGAVANNVTDYTTHQVYPRLALSSCMSCHIPAQDTFKSFLMPSPYLDFRGIVYTPGSPDWMKWFRDDYGNVAFNAGQVGMDYDMVMAYKSIGNWTQNQPSSPQNTMLLQNFRAIRKYRLHRSDKSQFWH